MPAALFITLVCIIYPIRFLLPRQIWTVISKVIVSTCAPTMCEQQLAELANDALSVPKRDNSSEQLSPQAEEHQDIAYSISPSSGKALAEEGGIQ